ncbi:DNA starvation/stationary phase protection protein [Lactobacillus xujianguonis]|uniref:DNA starvation/stationary phase protection protein n=1 Tax=Lactobacillus xujianguonis TaxID=2495899 RepID=A0A437SWV6_9LACO|nr:DNA starvation/stationary phase protection protein [Lactobacillus xujianguonis]RVU71340.1 DNA starvation/stationary phase protection protein [Lactobacillus xujianguonis]RVU74043.1 DNA starvation/stationary phase protection protein [Lactobacillus xujianguonis]
MKYPETKKVLNQLVADLTQMHMVVHQHHWYMRGERFLKLHPYLDHVMDELADQLDQVSERLVTLDGSPVSTLGEIVKMTKIPDEKGNWDETINERYAKIIDGYHYLDKLYEKGIEVSAKEGDDSTNDMLIAFHTAVEKRIWMMSAEIGKAPEIDQ